MEFKKHNKTLFNNSKSKYDITRPCLEIHQTATHHCTLFAPELAGPSGPTILERESRLLVLQYKCKYRYLRKSWVMHNGSRLPLIFMGGAIFCHSKERVHNLAMYFSLPLLFCTPSEVVRSESQQQHCQMLQAFPWIHFYLFSLIDAYKILSRWDLLLVVAINA